MEAEKRIRREIANSNERRRMQSINNGFQSLRSLLPHHEGEKLSKAAILQQTAEYIYTLEQEKTHLLSQNCQLKRLVNQHEGGDLLPLKKRKSELIALSSQSLNVHHISAATTTVLPSGCAVTSGPITSVGTTTDSSDEGLGSMSPEPVGGATPVELRRELERERSLRRFLEKQIHRLERQMIQQQTQQHQTFSDVVGEVIEIEDISKTDISDEMDEDVDDVDMSNSSGSNTRLVEEITLQVVAADSIPVMSHNPTMVCTESTTESSASSSQINCGATFMGHDSSTAPTNSTVPKPASRLQLLRSQRHSLSSTLVKPCGPSQPSTLQQSHQRLPSVLEAAIKAEPKVEVELLPTSVTDAERSISSSPSRTQTTTKRLYTANRSGQTLETIVEAIRHLEGDHLFGEEPRSTTTAQLSCVISNSQSNHGGQWSPKVVSSSTTVQVPVSSSMLLPCVTRNNAATTATSQLSDSATITAHTTASKSHVTCSGSELVTNISNRPKNSSNIAANTTSVTLLATTESGHLVDQGESVISKQQQQQQPEQQQLGEYIVKYCGGGGGGGGGGTANASSPISSATLLTTPLGGVSATSATTIDGSGNSSSTTTCSTLAVSLTTTVPLHQQQQQQQQQQQSRPGVIVVKQAVLS